MQREVTDSVLKILLPLGVDSLNIYERGCKITCFGFESQTNDGSNMRIAFGMERCVECAC